MFILVVICQQVVCFLLHHVLSWILKCGLLNFIIEVALFWLSSCYFIQWIMTAIIFFLLVSFQKIFSERFSTWVRDQFIFLIFIISYIFLFLFTNCGPPMDVSYEWRSLAKLMWLHYNLLSAKRFPCAYIWFRSFNIIFFDYHVFIFYLFVIYLVFSLSFQDFFILLISSLKLYFFVPLIFFIFIAQKLVLF